MPFELSIRTMYKSIRLLKSRVKTSFVNSRDSTVVTAVKQTATTIATLVSNSAPTRVSEHSH